VKSRDSEPPVATVERVEFTYRGTTGPALRGIDLTLRPGEMVGVMGASGAGKSTLAKCLNRLVPNGHYFTHAEGNSAAHVKASLIGTSQRLLVDRGKLLLGTWQALYLCEFDGPRERRVAVRICADG